MYLEASGLMCITALICIRLLRTSFNASSWHGWSRKYLSSFAEKVLSFFSKCDPYVFLHSFFSPKCVTLLEWVAGKEYLSDKSGSCSLAKSFSSSTSMHYHYEQQTDSLQISFAVFSKSSYFLFFTGFRSFSLKILRPFQTPGKYQLRVLSALSLFTP